jgi:hypothetical protein
MTKNYRERAIDQRRQGKHAPTHRPSGSDPLTTYLDDLVDVNVREAVTGDVLTKTADGDWVGAAPTGGTAVRIVHQVHYTLPLPYSPAPGPTNITGHDFTILAVLISSDGEVSGTLSPGGVSFSFSTGGGSTAASDLSETWTDGSQMTIDGFNAGGDGSYLSIDVAARQEE